MVSEARKQSMGWMEHRLQLSLKRYAQLTEEKMAAGAFGPRAQESDALHLGRELA